MLFDYIRLLKSISSTLTDISYENQDETLTPSLPLAPSDYFLIGMQYPFNNFFMHMAQGNGSRLVTPVVSIQTPYNAVGPIDEVQLITFPKVPSVGSWKIGYGPDETGFLAFNESAANIQNYIRNQLALGSVTVTGDYATGFTITLVGVASPSTLTIESNTLGAITPSALGVQYWNGNAWIDAVDVLDGTSVSGATLSKPGHILFSVDKTKTGWGKVNNPTIATQGPTELLTKHIYDLYWLKVKVTGQIPDDVTLNELGFAWTTDAKLLGQKAEVNRYLPSWKAGKTNWIPEIMTACKMMVTDLKKMGLVVGPQQVVRLDDLWLPATYKALWLIYSSLGPAYLETANAMGHQFYKTMNVPNLSIDQDQNGRLDDFEKDSRVMEGVR